jgi:hypothetical protein
MLLAMFSWLLRNDLDSSSCCTRRREEGCLVSAALADAGCMKACPGGRKNKARIGNKRDMLPLLNIDGICLALWG